MPKSDKATMLSRIHDVVRLLTAGAEFGDIRQYASDHGWQVSDRQVRRYMEAAYKRLARSTKRDRDQLLGRHLMQRRALYARSVKGDDLRTALQVLRDEAALQGLYPPTKSVSAVLDSAHGYGGSDSSPLTRRQRLVQLVAAEASGDKNQQRLVEHATPRLLCSIPDTMLPQQMLYTMTLIYVNEQLEHAGMFLHAVWRAGVEEDAGDVWETLALTHAFLLRIGREAWQQFTQEMKFDAEHLIQGNYQGSLLEVCQDNICRVAPTADEMTALFVSSGRQVPALKTAAAEAKSWRAMLAQVCRD